MKRKTIEQEARELMKRMEKEFNVGKKYKCTWGDTSPTPEEFVSCIECVANECYEWLKYFADFHKDFTRGFSKGSKSRPLKTKKKK